MALAASRRRCCLGIHVLAVLLGIINRGVHFYSHCCRCRLVRLHQGSLFSSQRVQELCQTPPSPRHPYVGTNQLARLWPVWRPGVHRRRPLRHPLRNLSRSRFRTERSSCTLSSGNPGLEVRIATCMTGRSSSIGPCTTSCANSSVKALMHPIIRPGSFRVGIASAFQRIVPSEEEVSYPRAE